MPELPSNFHKTHCKTFGNGWWCTNVVLQSMRVLFFHLVGQSIFARYPGEHYTCDTLHSESFARIYPWIQEINSNNANIAPEWEQSSNINVNYSSFQQAAHSNLLELVFSANYRKPSQAGKMSLLKLIIGVHWHAQSQQQNIVDPCQPHISK